MRTAVAGSADLHPVWRFVEALLDPFRMVLSDSGGNDGRIYSRIGNAVGYGALKVVICFAQPRDTVKRINHQIDGEIRVRARITNQAAYDRCQALVSRCLKQGRWDVAKFATSCIPSAIRCQLLL